MSSSSEGMEDIERLKPKRTAQRGRNTKIINEVSSALQKTDVTVEELTVLIERLTASNKRLEKINEEIDPQIPSAEIEEEYSVIAEYEDQALSALARLKCAINKLNAGHIATAAQNVTEAGEESGATPMVTSNIRAALSTGTGRIKLQKLDLYKFDGDLLSWQPFWEQYCSAVHDNPNLSPSEKFHYLRSRLTGQAAAAVSGLQTAEACYNDAVEILMKRFGDKKRIEQHLNSDC
ncbi:uncharacterized protein LOC135398456 [Ornithodoros turicata]|uniref:uncharacterized protein LOC135398456 n=1 Tax=Ornithodoros turicata TaxID=34597 RepID=UPI0031387B2F